MKIKHKVFSKVWNNGGTGLDSSDIKQTIDLTIEEVIKIINNLQAKELKEKGGRYAMRINAEELKEKLK